LSYGKLQAKQMKSVSSAFNDLNEAINYCNESGYRVYEIDARIALAWAYLVNNEEQKAKDLALRALKMGQDIGYYWGDVDSTEVLRLIGESKL